MSTHFILARNTRWSHKSQMWHLKWSISVDTNEGPTGVFPIPIPTPVPSSNPSPCPTPFKLNEMRKNGNNLILSDFQADMYYQLYSGGKLDTYIAQWSLPSKKTHLHACLLFPALPFAQIKLHARLPSC